MSEDITARPAGADLDLVIKVLERRMDRTGVLERRRLGALWCERAIKTHLANALGDAGSLDASSQARMFPRFDAENAASALGALARIASSHPAVSAQATPDVEVAVQALARAFHHLRVVDENPRELASVSSWIAKALIALGVPPDEELRAQLDDMGGLSDA